METDGIKSLNDLIQKWTKDTISDMRSIINAKTNGTGKLAKSLRIVFERGQSGLLSAILWEEDYGKYVVKGHFTRNKSNFIKGIDYTDPFIEFKKLIPEIEKEYIKFIEKELVKEIENKN